MNSQLERWFCGNLPEYEVLCCSCAATYIQIPPHEERELQVSCDDDTHGDRHLQVVWGTGDAWTTADLSQSELLRGGRSPRGCEEVGSACASASHSRGVNSEPKCSPTPGRTGRMEKQHWSNHMWSCCSISQQSPPKPHAIQMKIKFQLFEKNKLEQISMFPQQEMVFGTNTILQQISHRLSS